MGSLQKTIVIDTARGMQWRSPICLNVRLLDKVAGVDHIYLRLRMKQVAIEWRFHHNGHHFHENHSKATGTFLFRGQAGRCLHKKSRWSGSQDITKKQELKNDRHFPKNHWDAAKQFLFHGQTDSDLQFLGYRVYKSLQWAAAAIKWQTGRQKRLFYQITWLWDAL